MFDELRSADMFVALDVAFVQWLWRESQRPQSLGCYGEPVRQTRFGDGVKG